MSNEDSKNVKIVEGRRVWDKQNYVSKTESRLENEKNFSTDEKRKEKKPLEARKETLDLKTIVGKKYVLQSTEEALKVGLYCETCNISFKDSKSLLVHKNTREHVAKLGMTLQPVRSTVEDVRKKLQKPKVKKEKIKKPKIEEESKEQSEETKKEDEKEGK